MNCNTENQLTNVKQEIDPDCAIEVKLEPEVVLTETEECEIKDKLNPTYEFVPIIDVNSEVKRQSLDKYLENSKRSTQDKQLNTEEDVTTVHEHKSYHRGELPEDKCIKPINANIVEESNAFIQNDCSSIENSCSVGVDSVQKDLNSEVSDHSLYSRNNSNTNMKVGTLDKNSFTCNSHNFTECTDSSINLRPFKCTVCCKAFTRKIHLQVHERTHTNEKPFKCDFCFKLFSQKGHLAGHIERTHRNNRPFKCDICSKLFSQKYEVAEHILTHTSKKPFKCDFCSASFSHKTSRNTHMRTHTNDRLLECSICSKKFTKKSSLDVHTRSHTNEKPFECTLCTKSYSQKCGLDRHILTHTNEKPFKCLICSRSFSQKDHLTTHIRTHTNEKPFSCTLCNKSFAQQSTLTCHLRTHMRNLSK